MSLSIVWRETVEFLSDPAPAQSSRKTRKSRVDPSVSKIADCASRQGCHTSRFHHVGVSRIHLNAGRRGPTP